MKKIKVYLQYPWRFIDSSYYKNLLVYKTPGIDFLNKGNLKVIRSKRGFKINWFLKEAIRKIVQIVKIPNAIYSFNKESEIIHCAHCLSLNKKPWVVDFENYGALSASGINVTNSYLGKKIIKRLLRSQYCKRILPWTEAAKKSMLDEIDDPMIIKKIDLLPFAFKTGQFKPKKKKDRITILFIGRYFRAKGGYVAVEIMDKLTKKYAEVYGVILSETPKEVLEKYGKNKKIKFLNLMKQEKVFKEVYPEADIFFYPGFSDTFGFALVEAMSFKLPVITFEGFAREDIITEGKNGFIIKGKNLGEEYIMGEDNEILSKVLKGSKHIRKAIEKTELLIKDKKKRMLMGEYGYKMVKNGKFSIKERDKKLKRIYEEALK